MANVMKIKYADATLKQLVKAKATNPIKYAPLEGRTYEEILQNAKQNDRFEHYKSYDQYGRLTLVGKAKRLTDLQKRNLPQNSTIEEYFNALCKQIVEEIRKMIKKVNKNICPTMGPGKDFSNIL
jgi:hypothetical protein